MNGLLHRRPSASMVVAMTALAVASTGTAIAAGLVNGDRLIRKHSLSGNRLRNHSVTGAQVDLSKLGKVPSARNADHATSAATAVAATDARNAINAAALGGALPSAYEPASHFLRTGLVTATSGQTVALASFGPFTLSLVCVPGSGTAIGGQITATSTVPDSDGYGTALTTAGTSYPVITVTPGLTAVENHNNAADFFTPSGPTYIADLTVGQNAMGLTGKCFANALATPS